MTSKRILAFLTGHAAVVSAHAGPDCTLAPHVSLPSTGPVRSLAASGDLAIGARLLGTDLVAIAPDGALAPLTSVPSGSIFPPTCHSISIDGERAITMRGTGAVGATRVALLNIANAAAPTPIAHADITSEFILRRIALQDQHAFVMIQNAQSGIRALQTLDLSQGGFPFSLDSVNARDFVLDGQTIYVLTSPTSLEARDATQPFVLPLLGPPLALPNLGDSGLSLAVDSGRLYIRNTRGRIASVDVSNPAALQLLGASAADLFAEPLFFLPDTADLGVHNGVAYLAGVGDDLESAWLSAVDVSDPANPTEITRIPLPESSAYPVEITPSGVLVGADGFLHFPFIACPCPGDTDGDGFVGFKDLNTVLSAFNTAKGQPGFNAAADINGDGAVDFADMNVVISAFNTAC